MGHKVGDVVTKGSNQFVVVATDDNGEFIKVKELNLFKKEQAESVLSQKASLFNPTNLPPVKVRL